MVRRLRKGFVAVILSLGMILPVLSVPVATDADQTVITTATGLKYHFSKDCKGLRNARKIYQESLSSAKAKGLTPCKLCTSGASIKTTKKKANPITVKGKTATVKYSAVKKAAKKLGVDKVLKVSNAKGTVTYSKSSGNKNIIIHKTTGKVTIKKGLKKGTYKVKFKVKAAGNGSYKPKSVTVTSKIQIK